MHKPHEIKGATPAPTAPNITPTAAPNRKPQIPIDPKDWTVEDWRDLWNGIEEIRQRIAFRHAPFQQPPIDNRFVEAGCEQFDGVQTAPTPPALAHLQECLRESTARVSRLEAAISQLGYEDGDPADNVARYKRYATHEIELRDEGNRKLKAYVRRLQDLLPPESYLPIAREMAITAPKPEPDSQSTEQVRQNG